MISYTKVWWVGRFAGQQAVCVACVTSGRPTLIQCTYKYAFRPDTLSKNIGMILALT